MYGTLLPCLFSVTIVDDNKGLVFDIYRVDIELHAKLNHLDSKTTEGDIYPELIKFWKFEGEHESDPHPALRGFVKKLEKLVFDEYHSRGYILATYRSKSKKVA